MTTGQKIRLDQRLDQHADAMELVLNKLDQLERRARTLHRHAELIRRRLRELESIVLTPKPDHDDQTLDRFTDHVSYPH